MNSNYHGVKGFFKSFGFAWSGLTLLLFKERNFTIQFLIGIAVIISGYLFHISKTEWLMVLLSIALVLSLEIVNSAIETLADAITKEKNQKIKKSKDLAAGAVLLAAFGAAIVGGIIFFPKIWELINSLL